MPRSDARSLRLFSTIAAALLLCTVAASDIVAQARRDFTVTGHRYAYSVSGTNAAEIRVREDDLVTITFEAADIPHSFTISDDHYRIDRRAEPGKPVTFRFRADKAGDFEIRCNLTIDQRCLREMRGRLIVERDGSER